MTKKIRLIILLVCVACFFVVTPILVSYSMGYRFDFEKMKITAIGGIYVNANPKAEKIVVDNKIIKKPSILSNDVSFLDLLPKDHTVLVEKNGYYDYFKTIPVVEKQVTKLENILLFKKNIQFNLVTDKTQSPFNNQEKFVIKNNILYQKSTPVLKKVAAFSMQNNNIIWLGTDGFLYKSDQTNLSLAPTKVTLTAIKITKTGLYKIIADNQNIFLINNSNLLILNAKTNELANFSTSIKDAKISPDSKSIVYYDDKNIYLSSLPNLPIAKNTLYKSSEKISDCLWLNSNYIIFASGNKIIISEIDYRGNINTITLPGTLTMSPTQKIEIKNPQIFFNQQEGKIYILTGDNLLASEKIIP